MFLNRDTTDIQDWWYGSYGPIYGICASAQNDNMCLMANIETVYVMEYKNINERKIYSTHCNVITNEQTQKNSYSTKGLNVQTTYSVNHDPYDSQHIIICTTDMGLQNSYDGGKTWCRMKITTNDYSIYNTCYDLHFDTTTKNVVYGLWSSRHDAPYEPKTSDVGHTQGAFAISYDGGNVWDFEYSTGLPADCIPINMSVQNKNGELVVLVATFNRGFYISYNTGKTFAPLNKDVETYQNLIFGEDVVLDESDAYLLTAPYTQNGEWQPAKLYKHNLNSGSVSQIDMGEVVIARSLTYHPTKGVFVNVIPTYHYQWFEQYNDGSFVNDNGGIYKVDGNQLVYIFQNYNGIFNSGFSPNGTLFAADTYGKVFVEQNGKLELLVDDLFNMLKNISFSPDGQILYVTTFGGGVYRIDINHYLQKLKK